jgi:serine/threonine protein kinase
MAANLLNEPFLCEQTRTSFWLGQLVAAGGEGRIFTVARDPALVAKIYHHPTPQQAEKLKAMLSHPPEPKQTNILIAWPTDRVLDTTGRCVGFLMPRINQEDNVPLFKLYNPKDRSQTAPGSSWRYLLQTATNLASAVAVLHEGGYVVGDLNESNVLVSNSALVTLVDCDSMQVPSDNGKTFRCLVGKLDYTPPELQGKDFEQIDRIPDHDNFGLAVLIFMLLMEGVHPFLGSPPNRGTAPLPEANIRDGCWPYSPSSRLNPPPYALPLSTLPLALQDLMQRCFMHGSNALQQRPTAREWHTALREAQQHLSQCGQNELHWYSDHLTTCPWCERKSTKGIEPFPPRSQRPSTYNQSQTQRLTPGLSPYRTRSRSGRSGSAVAKPLSIVFRIVFVILVMALCSGLGSAFSSSRRTPTTPTIAYTPPAESQCPIGTTGPSCVPIQQFPVQTPPNYYCSINPSALRCTTPTSVVNPYTPDNGGKLVLSDPLSDNSKGVNWDGTSDANGSCHFASSEYHASATGLYDHSCIARNTDYNNFTFEARIQIEVFGKCGGILFRANSIQQEFYSFRICIDGTYGFYRELSSTVIQTLISPTSSSAINTGFRQTNLLAVVALDDAITLYINHQKITSIQDSTYSHGQIGVTVASASNGYSAAVSCSDVKVWSL